MALGFWISDNEAKVAFFDEGQLFYADIDSIVQAPCLAANARLK